MSKIKFISVLLLLNVLNVKNTFSDLLNTSFNSGVVVKILKDEFIIERDGIVTKKIRMKLKKSEVVHSVKKQKKSKNILIGDKVFYRFKEIKKPRLILPKLPNKFFNNLPNNKKLELLDSVKEYMKHYVKKYPKSKKKTSFIQSFIEKIKKVELSFNSVHSQTRGSVAVVGGWIGEHFPGPDKIKYTKDHNYTSEYDNAFKYTECEKPGHISCPKYLVGDGEGNSSDVYISEYKATTESYSGNNTCIKLTKSDGEHYKGWSNQLSYVCYSYILNSSNNYIEKVMFNNKGHWMSLYNALSEMCSKEGDFNYIRDQNQSYACMAIFDKLKNFMQKFTGIELDNINPVEKYCIFPNDSETLRNNNRCSGVCFRKARCTTGSYIISALINGFKSADSMSNTLYVGSEEENEQLLACNCITMSKVNEFNDEKSIFSQTENYYTNLKNCIDDETFLDGGNNGKFLESKNNSTIGI